MSKSKTNSDQLKLFDPSFAKADWRKASMLDDISALDKQLTKAIDCPRRNYDTEESLRKNIAEKQSYYTTYCETGMANHNRKLPLSEWESYDLIISLKHHNAQISHLIRSPLSQRKGKIAPLHLQRQEIQALLNERSITYSKSIGCSEEPLSR